MPHIIIEYTANAEANAYVPELIRMLNDVLTGYADVLPIGDIRTHALRLN